MSTEPTQRRTQAERRRETRRIIVRAVVSCLDERGYAHTTLAAVQQAAGMSRGALLHHFPSKHALIAAAGGFILDAALRVAREESSARGELSIEELLVDYWRTVANTPGGRAYVEIMNACRTDRALHELVTDLVQDWEPAFTLVALERFIGRRFAEDPEDVQTLWRVCTSFLRGLLLGPSAEPREAEQQIRLFARALVSMYALPDDGRGTPRR